MNPWMRWKYDCTSSADHAPNRAKVRNRRCEDSKSDYWSTTEVLGHRPLNSDSQSSPVAYPTPPSATMRKRQMNSLQLPERSKCFLMDQPYAVSRCSVPETVITVPSPLSQPIRPQVSVDGDDNSIVEEEEEKPWVPSLSLERWIVVDGPVDRRWCRFSSWDEWVNSAASMAPCSALHWDDTSEFQSQLEEEEEEFFSPVPFFFLDGNIDHCRAFNAFHLGGTSCFSNSTYENDFWDERNDIHIRKWDSPTVGDDATSISSQDSRWI
jgi:hypothetical protein